MVAQRGGVQSPAGAGQGGEKCRENDERGVTLNHHMNKLEQFRAAQNAGREAARAKRSQITIALFLSVLAFGVYRAFAPRGSIGSAVVVTSVLFFLIFSASSSGPTKLLSEPMTDGRTETAKKPIRVL